MKPRTRKTNLPFNTIEGLIFVDDMDTKSLSPTKDEDFDTHTLHQTDIDQKFDAIKLTDKYITPQPSHQNSPVNAAMTQNNKKSNESSLIKLN